MYKIKALYLLIKTIKICLHGVCEIFSFEFLDLSISLISPLIIRHKKTQRAFVNSDTGEI